MAGCGLSISSTATPLAGSFASRPHRSQCPSQPDVEILHTTEPERAYDELAVLKVTGIERSEDKELFAAIREKAAEVCADAVISISYGSEERADNTGLFCATCDDDFSATVIRGVAIRYRAPQATAACSSDPICAWED